MEGDGTWVRRTELDFLQQDLYDNDKEIFFFLFVFFVCLFYKNTAI